MFLQCTSGAALPWHRVPLQMVPGGGRRGHGDLGLGAAVVFHAWVTAWATCPPLPAFSRLCVRVCTGHSCAQPPRVQPCPLSQVPLTRGRIWAEVPQSPGLARAAGPAQGWERVLMSEQEWAWVGCAQGSVWAQDSKSLLPSSLAGFPHQQNVTH